jgi:hypothetical protein
MLLGLVIISVVAGISVTLIGYYAPFMILSTVFMVSLLIRDSLRLSTDSVTVDWLWLAHHVGA